MKPINEMNCEDIADYLHEPEFVLTAISRRLRELHEQHRWISVDERWPETEDVRGKVLVYSTCGRYWKTVDEPQNK
jgi:hypothetical protein